jgi:MOSC domain-containing protein
MEQYRPGVPGFPEASDETVVDEAMALVAPNTFFDAAPLHVVTTSTLARLGELAPDSVFPPQRFRPNVMVAVDTESGFVENGWVGSTIGFGDVRASVFLATPRCVMTTLDQGDLPRDPGVLQAIARHNRFDIPGLGPSSCVGVYALITTGGIARVGQPVEVM